ncbi:MAG: hypothetical protein M9894_01240 [Planctomycetes bacterium]|nr:hypothetical protein [Planctomycetota bacterium]
MGDRPSALDGVAARERAFRRGVLDEDGLVATVQSTLAHVARADARGLCRAWLARQPPLVWVTARE